MTSKVSLIDGSVLLHKNMVFLPKRSDTEHEIYPIYRILWELSQYRKNTISNKQIKKSKIKWFKKCIRVSIVLGTSVQTFPVVNFDHKQISSSWRG